MKNIIESQFTVAEVSAIDSKISDLKNALKGKTGILTAEERLRYGSVNEQNKLVVNKSRDFQQSNPELGAPNVDWNEFESDYQARIFLGRMICPAPIYYSNQMARD